MSNKPVVQVALKLSEGGIVANFSEPLVYLHVDISDFRNDSVSGTSKMFALQNRIDNKYMQPVHSTFSASTWFGRWIPYSDMQLVADWIKELANETWEKKS